MAHNIHEPIKQTSQPGKLVYEGLYNQFKMVIIIGLILIVASIASIIMQTDPWEVLIHSVPITILLGFLAVKLYPDKSLKKIYKHHFELDENGIYEEYIDPETEQVEEKQSIPFSSVHRILVGNFVMEYDTKKRSSKKSYECSAIMIIEHENGNYLRIFNNMDEFKNWLPRFLDKDCLVVKTEYNLAPAFYEIDQDDIDFSEITGEPWSADTIYPPIGDKSLKSPFVTWEYNKAKQADSLEENQKKAKQKIQRTRKWENRTMLALAAMSFMIGVFIFPFTPVEDNGALTLTYTMILIMAFMILYPICLVFWRSHTRWYLPILYFIVTAGVGTGIFLLFSFILNSPVSYIRVGQFYMFVTVIGWIPAFIIFKIIRGFMGLGRKE
ncbi:MAG TPA: DUF2427 domain-containing protein [Candidatus Avamphibacillus sp.]|nr:DUF2427 domain-containing protein [Candidatus Avamphibacillus sp.]